MASESASPVISDWHTCTRTSQPPPRTSNVPSRRRSGCASCPISSSPAYSERGRSRIGQARIPPGTAAARRLRHMLGAVRQRPLLLRTAKQDVVLIHERLRTAQSDYEVRYAKKED